MTDTNFSYINSLSNFLNIEPSANYIHFLNRMRMISCKNESNTFLDQYAKKVFFYAIYDHILSPEWGSQRYEIAKYFVKKINWDMVNTQIIYNSCEPKIGNFVVTMRELYDYLNNPSKIYGVCNFGTTKHATCLHLTKLSGGIIELCYINTGLGIDETYENKDEYFNLFKITYFKNEDINKFIQFIQPFIFYTFFTKKDIQDNIYNNALYYIEEEVLKYKKDDEHIDYSVFYNLVYGGDSDYFKEINKIFSNETYYIFNKNLYERIINVNFVKLWNEKLNEIKRQITSNNLDYDPLNYVKLGFETIKYEIVDSKIYIIPQNSGSCTYRSILTAWIYNTIIISDNEELKRRINQYYSYCHNLIQENTRIVSSNTFVYDDVYLYDLLNKDKIIKYINSNGFKERYFNFKERTEIGEMYVPKLMDKTKLEDIISQVRNKTYTNDIYDVFFDDYKVNNNAILDKKIVQCKLFITEMLLVVLLSEYYNNAEKWKKNLFDKGTIDVPKYLNTFRIELMEHEEFWISNFFCKIGPLKDKIDISDLEKYINILKIDDWANFLIKDIRTGMDSSCEQLLIKKLIFNKTNNNKIKRTLVYFFNAKYILIDYLKKNYLSLDKILMETTSDNNLLNNLLYYLLDFIANNIKYIGELQTKNITICLFKVFLNLWNNNFYLDDLRNDIKNLKLFKQVCVNITLLNDYMYDSDFRMSLTIEDDHMKINDYFWNENNYDPDYYFKRDRYEILANYNLEKIFMLLKKLIIESDNDKSIENFKSHKPIIFKISYGGLDYKPIKIDFISYNHLINSLVYCDNVYYNNENNSILIIIDTNNFNFNTNGDKYIVIKYEKTLWGDSELLLDQIKINNDDAIIQVDGTNVVPIYPFLIFAPATSVNFIINKNNDSKLIVIKRKYYDISFYHLAVTTNYYYQNAIFLENEGFYLELPINKNKLTIMMTDDMMYKYNEIIKYCNYLYPFVNNKWNFKTDINLNTQLSDTTNISELEKCTDNFCKFLNKYVSSLREKINITKFTTIKKSDYDIINCVYCLNKELNTTENDKISKSVMSEFINNNLVCNINYRIDFVKLEVLQSYIEQINKLIISKFREINYSKINSANYTIINLIYDNYTTISVILKCSLFIESIKQIISMMSSDNINCHEILEIEKSIVNNINNNKLYGIAEIILGLNVKEFQWNKVSNIISNYESKDKWKVHHFAMGKGKSAVITPMLIIYFASNNKKVNIIVPTHLVKQTKQTLNNAMYYFNIDINIYDDDNIKIAYLNNKIDNKAVYLIDEFDFMYNPLQSNFNIIEKQKSILTDDTDENHINKKTIDIILERIYKYKEDNTIIEAPKFSLLSDINEILKTSDTHIKNISYGMSLKQKNKRFCIPYARQHTPLENSMFSSNLLTIVLTIFYFYQNNFILEDEDLYIISSIKNTNLTKLICEYYDIPNLALLVLPKFKENKKMYFDVKEHSETEISKRKEIFKLYIIYIVRSIEQTEKIKNTSFFDIINNNTLWQVGYSGTINLDIPNNPIMKYSNEIEKDYDEIFGTYFALTGNYTNSRNKFYKINNIEEVYKHFESECNVLIDACAYFRDYSNVEVAQHLYNVSYKKVIFLLNDDSRKIIIDGKVYPYDETIYNNNEVIYYYSQRHTVGIDFKQPTILNGLVLIDDNNNYTQIAQAIFRMRKLNRGHVVNIGYCGIKEHMDKDKLYKQLVEKDMEFLKNTEETSFLQFFKSSIRKYITKNYIEQKIEPLYTIEPNKICIFIKNKIDIDILNLQNLETNEQFLLLDDEIKSGILSIVSRFSQYNLDKLISLFYNSKAIEVNTDLDVQKDVQKEVQKEVQKFKYNIKYDKIQIKYLYNPEKEQDKYYPYVYFQYRFNENRIFFSSNIFTIQENDELILCIVQINDNDYLIENSYNIDYYYKILPVYTIDGYIINYNILSIKPTKTIIDVKMLFNCILHFALTGTSYKMYDLINEMADENTQTITLQRNDKNFIFLITYIYNNANIINTSEIRQNEYDLKQELYTLYFFNDAINFAYKDYIINIIFNNLCRLSLSKTQIYNVRNFYILSFNYIEFAYSGQVFDNNDFNFAEDSFHKKYLKYKNKYLALKKSLSKK